MLEQISSPFTKEDFFVIYMNKQKIPTISKSEFMMFLKHPAWLWLKKYDKDKLPVPDESLQALFDEGEIFERYAESIFEDAVKLGYKSESGEFSGTKYYALPDKTLETIKSGAKVILQGRLEVNNTTSVFDVLERVGDKEFDLYEIKSSTSVKPEHIPDLAFQTIVLEDSGFKVRNVYVLHVNNKYVRDGEIRADEISLKSEVTDDVRDIIDETRENIKKAFEVLNEKSCPDISPRHLNKGGDTMAEWLAIYQLLRGEFPKNSIYNICRPDPKTIAWLEDEGIEVLEDIPLDAPLSEPQLRQIEAMKSGVQKIDHEELDAFFKELRYPLYFLDYETMSGVIPSFDGYRPYQQIPFQYSLHILEAPPRLGSGQAGEELEHKEYLHTQNTDPVPELLKHLREDMGEEGTVISWYMSFEKNRNSEMAEIYPEYSAFLAGVNERMVDLMVPFSKGWFVDKEFFGRSSIKWVLPALLPELSYKELEISNGGQAQRVWMQTVLGGRNPEKKEKIMEDLRKYCGLDTYAMYAILKYLKNALEK